MALKERKKILKLKEKKRIDFPATDLDGAVIDLVRILFHNVTQWLVGSVFLFDFFSPKTSIFFCCQSAFPIIADISAKYVQVFMSHEFQWFDSKAAKKISL